MDSGQWNVSSFHVDTGEKHAAVETVAVKASPFRAPQTAVYTWLTIQYRYLAQVSS